MLIFSSVWLCWLAWTTITFDMKIVYFLVISLTDCTLQNDFGFLTTVTFRFISNVICLQCGFWLYVAQSTCVGCLLSETSVWLNLNEEWYEHHKSAEEVCNEAVSCSGLPLDAFTSKNTQRFSLAVKTRAIWRLGQSWQLCKSLQLKRSKQSIFNNFINPIKFNNRRNLLQLQSKAKTRSFIVISTYRI